MKIPRTWLTVVVPVALLAVVGLVIISGTNNESRSLQSEDQVTEVSFITGDEIPALLANGRCSMIEFGGRSCTPCKQMQPILDRVQPLSVVERKCQHPTTACDVDR